VTSQDVGTVVADAHIRQDCPGCPDDRGARLTSACITRVGRYRDRRLRHREVHARGFLGGVPCRPMWRTPDAPCPLVWIWLADLTANESRNDVLVDLIAEVHEVKEHEQRSQHLLHMTDEISVKGRHRRGQLGLR